MENEGVLGQVPEEVEPVEPQEVIEPVEPEGEPEGEPQEPIEPQEPEVKTVPLKALEEERRKRQEMAKRLEEVEKKLAPPPKQPQTIDEFYEVDPKGTMDYLNNEIARLTEEDPFGNVRKIENLRDTKEELRLRGATQRQNQQSRFVTDLNKAIDGFDKKREALTTFATSELGYTPQELAMLTNPGVVGHEAAIKTVKLINRQFEAKQAPATLKSKEVKPKATQVEPPGEGLQPPAPDAQVAKLYEQAKKGEIPWHKYFEATGI